MPDPWKRKVVIGDVPLAIDLFCGLGGWTEGLLAEGYYVVGFDIERHEYWMPDESSNTEDGSKGTKPIAKRGWTQGCGVSLGMEGANAKPRTRLVKYSAPLVLQDILTLHGKQFKDAALIVASPPCQEFSYMAMPWPLAKEKQRRIETDPAEQKRLTALFDACFRIQREACAAAGRHIPLVVENVKGAQKWVGRARWNFGSFYLWGDVPALMPIVTKRRMKFPADCGPRLWSEREYVRLNDGNASAFHHEGATKNAGGSWFGIGSPGQKVTGRNPVHELTGQKTTEHRKNGADWFGSGSDCSLQRKASSRSNARKAASLMIAKIPFELARYIARVWWPGGSS